MTNKQWIKRLKEYKKQAYRYYDTMKICPTPEEILDYVCEEVEEQSGADVDKATAKRYAKILGLTI